MSSVNREDGRIRILFIITTLQVGGAEGQFVRLVTGLDRERYEIAVCCLSGEGPYREVLDTAGIPVTTIGFTGFWGMRRDPGRVPRQIFRLIKYIRDFRPHIVHGFLFWAYVMGAFAARVVGVPIIVSSRRSLGYFKGGNRRHLLMERLANHFTDVVVANSGAVRQDAIAQEQLRPAKVEVIYNGIDARRFDVVPDPEARRDLGLGDRGPVVGVVANFRLRKGFEYFLEAWAEVTRRFPNAVAILVGDGPMKGESETQAEFMGLSSSVRFLGSRRDIPELLALMDILVHPSLEEGFSNAILEGMAAGRPVVATAVGGNPEAVTDGVTGLLVPPGDSNSLASSVLWLMEHPEKALEYGRAGRERVSTSFDLPAMISGYEHLYTRLAAGKGIGLQPDHHPRKIAER